MSVSLAEYTVAKPPPPISLTSVNPEKTALSSAWVFRFKAIFVSGPLAFPAGEPSGSPLTRRL